MTNEEFDRRMEFILSQQAQFASDITRIEDVVGRLANASLSRFEDVDEKIAALVDSQVRGDEKIAALVDSQGRTEESLRNLIAVVDRYFSDRNGGSSGPGPTNA